MHDLDQSDARLPPQKVDVAHVVSVDTLICACILERALQAALERLSIEGGDATSKGAQRKVRHTGRKLPTQTVCKELFNVWHFRHARSGNQVSVVKEASHLCNHPVCMNRQKKYFFI